MRTSAVVVAGVAALLFNLIFSTDTDACGRRGRRHLSCCSCHDSHPCNTCHGCYDAFQCPQGYTCICCGDFGCDLCANIPTCQPGTILCVRDPRLRIDCSHKWAPGNWTGMMADGLSGGAASGKLRKCNGVDEINKPDVLCQESLEGRGWHLR